MTARIRAARYLRMSLEAQKYSLENQADAIEEYANLHGYEIVQTYSDAGKSGLALCHRDGLSGLLRDVLSGNVSFQAILVYDISRWGRFQDVDESAHYEFLCRQAGVPIHYCAEPFANDGTLASVILKAMKRTMAREYSRELGVKIYEGQRRLAELGFHVSGPAPYGFRRMLMSASGKQKQLLAPGEHKSLLTDRIILVSGPRREQVAVRRMFEMAACGRSPGWIAREFNRQGIRFTEGRRWRTGTVALLLRNPKYAGENVWGRTSLRLRSPRQRTSPAQWVRKPDAFVPMVHRATFDKAQRMLARYKRYRSEEDLLRPLRRLLTEKGRLSGPLINSMRRGPSVSTYRLRFGSLGRVYELMGFHANDNLCRSRPLIKQIRALRSRLLAKAEVECPATEVLENGRSFRRLLRLSNGAEVLLVMACSFVTLVGRQRRWRLNVRRAPQGRPYMLLALLNADNTSVESVYFLRDEPRRITLHAEHPVLRRGQRLEDIEEFCRRAVELTEHAAASCHGVNVISANRAGVPQVKSAGPWPHRQRRATSVVRQ